MPAPKKEKSLLNQITEGYKSWGTSFNKKPAPKPMEEEMPDEKQTINDKIGNPFGKPKKKM